MQKRRILLLLVALLVALPLVIIQPISPALTAAADVSAADAALGLAAVPHPANLAAGAAAIITGLLLLLYLYRRCPYIPYWTGGWACLAASLATAAGRPAAVPLAAFAFGAAQFLSVASAVLFVVAADSYHARRRLRPAHGMMLVPVAIWFLMAPLALGTAAAFVPGHLLTAVTLAVAGGAHLMILRDSRLIGAGVVGTTLLITAGTKVWTAVAPGAPPGPALSEVFLIELALYLITALGMQLMTFEDMTCELRGANGRLETAQTELRQMVVTDALTGCRNRRFFDEIIPHALNHHRRYATPLSLLFVDVDHFKSINDAMGHAAGDRVLRDVAAFLMRKTRDADYVFRWGGDEFLLLLSCREEEAVRRGLELQQDFQRSPAAGGLPSGVGLSFGCAEVSPSADTAMDALKLADDRMYEDKRRVRMPDERAM